MNGSGLTRLLRTAWTATLVAGAIGVVRQRGESRRVRAGSLEPDGPDGERAPRTPHAPVMAALATWVPRPPASDMGRLVATLWSAPLSAVGLGVALASGARPRWDADRRCLVATGVGGPSGAALRLVGAGANTIGQVVLCRSDAPSSALLDHEAVHVRQAERLGPLLVPIYLWCNAIHGYRDNPLEHAARRGARAAGAARTVAAAGADDDASAQDLHATVRTRRGSRLQGPLS
jgi:hypothetical protein